MPLSPSAPGECGSQGDQSESSLCQNPCLPKTRIPAQPVRPVQDRAAVPGRAGCHPVAASGGATGQNRGRSRPASASHCGGACTSVLRCAKWHKTRVFVAGSVAQSDYSGCGEPAPPVNGNSVPSRRFTAARTAEIAAIGPKADPTCTRPEWTQRRPACSGRPGRATIQLAWYRNGGRAQAWLAPETRSHQCHDPRLARSGVTGMDE